MCCLLLFYISLFIHCVDRIYSIFSYKFGVKLIGIGEGLWWWCNQQCRIG